MQLSAKKWLQRIAIIIAILFLIYIVYLLLMLFVLMYMIKPDKNYEQFCTNHISLIDNYYIKNGVYPPSLNILDRKGLNIKYLERDCGYTKGEKGYGFHISHGLGVAGYSSIDKKWWYD